MRRLLGLACLALTLLAATAQAGAEVRTVRATAHGGDRDDAVLHALGDALRQVHGGEIATRRETSTSLRRTVRDGERRTESDRRTSSDTAASSEGLISGYRIISLERTSGDGFLATLEVDVPVYHVADVQSDRQRIAVYPVEASSSGYDIADSSLVAAEASGRLTQSIVAMLVQSRRFSVLDRDMRDAIEREHGFLGRADVPMREKLAIGHTLGADLLLVSRLRRLDASVLRERDPWTGETRLSHTGGAVLEARVVMPSTGQLMWAKTVQLDASDFPRPMRAQGVIDAIGGTLVHDLLDGIYPIRVVEGFGDAAVIGRGGDMLRTGQRYDVFEVGRRYADPYRPGTLGARERRVATVEVTSVGSRTSRVRVLDGRVSGDGHVLRRLQGGTPGLAAGLPGSDRRLGGAPAARPKICLPGDPC